MNIRITKIHPNAIIPTHATPGSACFDLYTAEDATISPHGAAKLRTGLVIGLPQDHVMLMFARSSTYGKYGIILANGVGVLDADYCGPTDEWHISVRNMTDAPITITAGTRLVQAIVMPRPRVTFDEGPALGPSRGGFGSTGT